VTRITARAADRWYPHPMALDDADWNALSAVLAADAVSRMRAAYAAQPATIDRDTLALQVHAQGGLTDEQLAAALRIRLRLELTHRSELSAPRSSSELSPAGRYLLLGVAGVGAMGRVWVGKDLDLRRKVAYKELGAHLDQSAVERQRFLTEAQITAQLDHPNIPPVYGLEVGSDGQLGYAMKLVDGRTLREHLTDCYQARVAGGAAPVSLAERLDWFLKVCDAVAYAHSREVLHRDLKPENVMIGPFGEVWVMDWGLARLSGSAAPPPAVRPPAGFDDSASTHVGEVEGTPASMSPEQARGERDLRPASDQYALGLLLQELVTLVPPRRIRDAREARLAAAKGQREVVPRQAPRALAAIVNRACALEPRRRYPSVGELAADVRRYLRDEPVQALHDGLARSAWKGLVRNREWVLGGGLLVLVLGIGVALSSTSLLFAERWSAVARQERLGVGIAQVGEQAHRIDKEILEYDRRLEVVAGAATQLLLHGRADADAVIYDSVAFTDSARQPPDLALDPRFGVATSRSHGVVHAAPGTSAAALQYAAERLVHLDSELERQSGSNGPPLGWTFVGTEEGVHASWPGHGGLAADFDPRKRPWYVQARASNEPVWGAPYTDAGGLGLVVPCSRALRGPDGVLLGVAGLDVPLRHVVEDLLTPDTLAVREAWLLDGEGRVLVSSKSPEAMLLNPVPFPDPVVVTAASTRHSRTLRRPDGTWVLVYPLSAVAWSYVVEVDEGSLVTGRPR
jgi:serine/threonine-protein kinase